MNKKKLEDMTIKEGLKGVVRKTLEDYPLLPQVMFIWIPFCVFVFKFLIPYLLKM